MAYGLFKYKQMEKVKMKKAHGSSVRHRCLIACCFF